MSRIEELYEQWINGNPGSTADELVEESPEVVAQVVERITRLHHPNHVRSVVLSLATRYKSRIHELASVDDDVKKEHEVCVLELSKERDGLALQVRHLRGTIAYLAKYGLAACGAYNVVPDVIEFADAPGLPVPTNDDRCTLCGRGPTGSGQLERPDDEGACPMCGRKEGEPQAFTPTGKDDGGLVVCPKCDHFITPYPDRPSQCPMCASDNITGDSLTVEDGGCSQRISCDDCGGRWRDVYELRGFVNPEPSAETAAAVLNAQREQDATGAIVGPQIDEARRINAQRKACNPDPFDPMRGGLARPVEFVVFMQGEEAEPVMKMIEDDPNTALEHLKQWHFPSEHRRSDDFGTGESDHRIDTPDGYRMSWDTGIPYVGLDYREPDNDQRPTSDQS